MPEQHNTVTAAIGQLETTGTIVISCSREDLLCLLAKQILEETDRPAMTRRGQVVRLWQNHEDVIEKVRTLAELVLLYFED